jgi:hypothetical protein
MKLQVATSRSKDFVIGDTQSEDRLACFFRSDVIRFSPGT